jgi:hypothetical protein
LLTRFPHALPSQLLAAPPLPGPPATFIIDSSRPLGQVFPRFDASNVALTPDGWVRPSVPAEAAGTVPYIHIAFGATSGGALHSPCSGCAFACRLDVGEWVTPCASPFRAAALSPGEHLFQVRAFAPDGTPDPAGAVFHAWAIELLPWVGFAAVPAPAVNTTSASFDLVAAAGCALTYSMNGTSWAPVPGGGNVSAPLTFALPEQLVEGYNTLHVACTLAGNTSAIAKHTWRLDTWAPVALFPAGAGLLPPGAVVHRDGAAWAVVGNDTDATGQEGSGAAALFCRLVALSGNDTAPPPLSDWTPCGAAPLSAVQLPGLLGLPSGSYALQAFAVDAAGNAGDASQASFDVDATLPLTPTATVAPGTVTLTPEASSVLSTQFYLITNISNGVLLLSDGITNVTNGSFITAQAGADGLRFEPLVVRSSGVAAKHSFYGFDVQAADAADASRLGGDVLHVNATVLHGNTAPWLDAARVFALRDAFSTGASLHGAEAGQAVADILAGGVADADGDAIGLAVLSTDCHLGAWESSNDAGASWASLAAASTAAPILVAGGAAGRLRFTPWLDAPGVFSTTEWAASASIAFRAWDGSDGAVAGTSCLTLAADSAAAAAAVAQDAAFAEAVNNALDAGGGDVCAPLNTTFAPGSAYSADTAVAVVSIYDLSLLRGTETDTTAARTAAASFAAAAAGCPPPYPGAVELPLRAAGGAALLLGGGALADLAPPWTLEAWVRKTARLASAVLLASAAYPAPSSAALLLEAAPATFMLGVRQLPASASAAAATTTDVSLGVEAPLGMWTHLAFVADGAELLLYVNGMLAGADAALGGMALPRGWVGDPTSGAASAFVIDELRMWSVARSARDIAAARNTQLPPPDAPAAVAAAMASGLLTSIRFEEGCGVNASDAAAGTAAATLAGGAAWARGVQLACASVGGSVPAAGPLDGGNELTLLGAGFLIPPSAAAACVFSDGSRARLLRATTDSVTCIAPPAAGRGAVRVSYDDPVLGCHAPDAADYTYTAATVASVYPDSGPLAGGTLIAVHGAGLYAPDADVACRFTPLAAATLLGTAAVARMSPARAVSSSSVVCESPPVPAAGAYLLEVSLHGTWAPHPQRFTFAAAAVQTLMTQPNGSAAAAQAGPWRAAATWLQSGPTAGGGLLRAPLPPAPSGALPRTALPSCGFGTLRPVAARLVGAHELECAAPARVRGPAAVALSVNGRDWETAGADGPRRFISHSPPRAELLYPEEAPAAGGATLTVLGAGGGAARALSCAFGASAADGASPADAHTARGLGIALGQGVRCVAPGIAPGFVALRIMGDGIAASTAAGAGVLQYLAREAPRVTAAFPRALAASGGTLVGVTGTHFTTTAACSFAGVSAPLHFVSTALLVCEAPAAAARGVSSIAVALPQSRPDAAIAIAFVNATQLANVSFAAGGGVTPSTLDALCAFGTVRVAATSVAGGVVACRPAGTTASAAVPVGIGASWQDVTFAAIVATPAPFGQYASAQPMSLNGSPSAGPAAGLFALTLYADIAASVDDGVNATQLVFGCRFLEPARTTDVPAAAADASLQAFRCTAPPAASARGGFVAVRLLVATYAAGAGESAVDVATAQVMFEPRARIMSVALPRPAARGTDGAGRAQCGRTLWSGRPVSVSGAHLPGARDAGAACRFDAAVRPGGWVSTALLRCELSDAAMPPGAQLFAALAVAHADAAADEAAWSPPSSAARFAWPRASEEEQEPGSDAC